MKINTKIWYLEELPCYRENALCNGESPPCLFPSEDGLLIKEFDCPAYVKMKDSIERIKTEAYQAGYGFVAFVVRKGPRCELVAFSRDPNEDDLRKQYGDDLIAIVPV
jgi:hypothetical protein